MNATNINPKRVYIKDKPFTILKATPFEYTQSHEASLLTETPNTPRSISHNFEKKTDGKGYRYHH